MTAAQLKLKRIAELEQADLLTRTKPGEWTPKQRLDHIRAQGHQPFRGTPA